MLPHQLTPYPKTIGRYQRAMSNVAVLWHPLPIPLLAVGSASGLVHLCLLPLGPHVET